MQFSHSPSVSNSRRQQSVRSPGWFVGRLMREGWCRTQRHRRQLERARHPSLWYSILRYAWVSPTPQCRIEVRSFGVCHRRLDAIRDHIRSGPGRRRCDIPRGRMTQPNEPSAPPEPMPAPGATQSSTLRADPATLRDGMDRTALIPCSRTDVNATDWIRCALNGERMENATGMIRDGQTFTHPPAWCGAPHGTRPRTLK